MRQIPLFNPSPGDSCIQARPYHVGTRLAEVQARAVLLRGDR
jgi:hypothetical protein